MAGLPKQGLFVFLLVALQRVVARLGTQSLSGREQGEGVELLNGIFSSPGQTALESRLASLIAQREALSQQITNLDTPGYNPASANTFAAQLQSRLDAQLGVSAGASGQAALPPLPGAASGGVVTPDQNGVDFDATMVNLAKTDLGYQAVARQLQLTYQNLTTAVDAGGA